MYVSEQKISEILDRSDIVDLISEVVILKKSGRNFFGICPFHAEKTPSFSVNPDKQIFYCFGCGTGGNALSFIMKYHGIDFIAAIKMLATKLNIALEIDSADPSVNRRLKARESLSNLNKIIMFHYASLLQDTKQASVAREYLKKRGINFEIINKFSIGYAPDEWNNLVDLLQKNHIDWQIVTDSGMIIPKKQNNGFYDRFRNRIIFPIFDINEHVAGFGGRVMNDAMPKYMNSPETEVYKKSRILYGLNASKKYCRTTDVVFIVEGYFDFLSLYQNGVKNCVATLGTALTSEHVRILKGYASKMILVFDSDTAGINAAKRSIKIFMREGIDTRILVLPDGNDPDSFIWSSGLEAWERVAQQAQTIIDFLLGLSVRTHSNSVEGRVKVIAEMKSYLAEIGDIVLRSLYIKNVAEFLGIDEKILRDKVREHIQYANDRTPGKSRKDVTLIKNSYPREEQIVTIMLNFPQIISTVEESRVIDYFYSDRLKKITELIKEVNYYKSGRINDILTKIDKNEDREYITSLAMKEFTETDDIQTTVESIIRSIIRVRKKSDDIITSKIMNAERNGDSDIMELLRLKQQEIQQLHQH